MLTNSKQPFVIFQTVTLPANITKLQLFVCVFDVLTYDSHSFSMSLVTHLIFVWMTFLVGLGSAELLNGTNSFNHARQLQATKQSNCDTTTRTNPLFKRYFDGMDSIYHGNTGESTCYPVHKQCGWPAGEKSKKLPLFVLSVGLEGAGHHLWTEILEQPVFNCVWKNARHYHRDIADGVPRATAEQLKTGFMEQFKLRRDSGKPPCKSIYDSEDSFPTGAIRQNGRVFMRPDIVNLQQLDGVLFEVKYLIIIRNTTVIIILD